MSTEFQNAVALGRRDGDGKLIFGIEKAPEWDATEGYDVTLTFIFDDESEDEDYAICATDEELEVIRDTLAAWLTHI
jgi:hypothetical protein